MSTFFPSGTGLAESRKWFLVDAKGKTVGRLATEIARIITGKNNPKWTPFMDVGDFVVVINAKHAVFKSGKLESKVYRHHTLYPGGVREISAQKMLEKHPERIIESAVKGMLPKNKLGRAMAKKLKVYADGNHQHTAQKPEILEIKES
jgi:large subunit ribosomal protein L13